MNDRETTVQQLKDAIRQLCTEKHWGENGEQDPMHVAIAMSVEMAELLEHFQWKSPEEIERLRAGQSPELAAKIAEECADVFNYGLQLMYTLGQDISSQIERKLDHVRNRPTNYDVQKQQMRDSFEEEITKQSP